MNRNDIIENHEITIEPNTKKTYGESLEDAKIKFAIALFNKRDLITNTCNFPPDCQFVLFESYDENKITNFEEPTLFRFKDKLIYANGGYKNQWVLTPKKQLLLDKRLEPSDTPRSINYRDMKNLNHIANINLNSVMNENKTKWTSLAVQVSRMRKNGSSFKKHFKWLSFNEENNKKINFDNTKYHANDLFFSQGYLPLPNLHDAIKSHCIWAGDKKTHKNGMPYTRKQHLQYKAKNAIKIGGNCSEYSALAICLALACPTDVECYKEFEMLRHAKINIKNMRFRKETGKFDFDHAWCLLDDRYVIDGWFGDVVDMKTGISLITGEKNPPLYLFIKENEERVQVLQSFFIGEGLSSNHIDNTPEPKTFWEEFIKKPTSTLLQDQFIAQKISKEDMKHVTDLESFYKIAKRSHHKSNYKLLRQLTDEKKIKINSTQEFFELCVFCYYHLPNNKTKETNNKIAVLNEIACDNFIHINLFTNIFENTDEVNIEQYISALDTLLKIQLTKDDYINRINNFFRLFPQENCFEIVSALKAHVKDIEMFNIIKDYIASNDLVKYTLLFKPLILCSKDLATVINGTGYMFLENEMQEFLDGFRDKFNKNENFDVFLFFKNLSQPYRLQSLDLLKDIVKKTLNEMDVTNTNSENNKIAPFIKLFSITRESIPLFEEIIPEKYHDLLPLKKVGFFKN